MIDLTVHLAPLDNGTIHPNLPSAALFRARRLPELCHRMASLFCAPAGGRTITASRPILSAIALCASVLPISAPVAAEPGSPSLSWGYSSFGVPGLIDMPSALSREDAELALSLSHFKNQTRGALSFQISDRLSATFRNAALYHIRSYPGAPIYGHRFDRSFSLHYRLVTEGDYLPAIAIGLNDIVGTGIYGGEYLVVSKTVTQRLRATIGHGWAAKAASKTRSPLSRAGLRPAKAALIRGFC